VCGQGVFQREKYLALARCGHSYCWSCMSDWRNNTCILCHTTYTNQEARSMLFWSTENGVPVAITDKETIPSRFRDDSQRSNRKSQGAVLSKSAGSNSCVVCGCKIENLSYLMRLPCMHSYCWSCTKPWLNVWTNKCNWCRLPYCGTQIRASLFRLSDKGELVPFNDVEGIASGGGGRRAFRVKNLIKFYE
jgi:hypothetical protein